MAVAVQVTQLAAGIKAACRLFPDVEADQGLGVVEC
jgi:hypothetical protein